MKYDYKHYCGLKGKMISEKQGKFNARGEWFNLKDAVYPIKDNFNIMLVRKAIKKYKCESCRCDIDIGDWHGSPAIKGDDKHYCLDCVTHNREVKVK